LPAKVFERPPAEAMQVESRDIAVEFGIAPGAIQRTAKSWVTSGSAFKAANASLSESASSEV